MPCRSAAKPHARPTNLPSRRRRACSCRLPAWFRQRKAVVQPRETLEGVSLVTLTEHLPVHIAADSVGVVHIPNVSGLQGQARSAQRTHVLEPPESRLVAAIGSDAIGKA